VIALGPYLGPTEEELIEMDNQEFERQEVSALHVLNLFQHLGRGGGGERERP
jgi:hypothetical protein